MRYFILLVTIILFNGCFTNFSQRESTYQINTIHDKFENCTIIRMKYNKLSTSESSIRWNDDLITINLLPQKYIDRNSDITISLVISYSGNDWLFIPTGESLVLLVDGERIGLSGEGSIDSREATRYGVYEHAVYDIDKSLLKKLGNANNVEVKLEGSNGYIVRKFSPVNFDNIKRFINEYCNY